MFVEWLDNMSIGLIVAVVFIAGIALWKARKNGKGTVGSKGTGQGS
jgi:hypothetical protein